MSASRLPTFLVLGLLVVGVGVGVHSWWRPQPLVTPRAQVDLSAAEVPKTEAKREAVPDSNPDTLLLSNGEVLRLEPISRQVFEAAVAFQKPVQGYTTPDSLFSKKDVKPQELRRIKADSTGVSRQVRQLVLQPQQGSTVILTNTLLGASNAIEYVYLMAMPEIAHWLVEAWAGGEALQYILVNQRTGQRTWLLGYPVVAPGARWLACSSTVMTHGTSGLMIWRVTGNDKLSLYYKQVGSGFPEIKWDNGNTLLLMQQVDEETGEVDEDGISIRYVRLRLPN
jgi:hypothetical protein